MANSLQDQLKKSGLVDEKKAKQLARAKRKESKQAAQSRDDSSSNTQTASARAKAENLARDKQLNKEKLAKANIKATKAQIAQLIEANLIAKKTEQKYSFTDANKIKHVWVGQDQVNQLSLGIIAIVRLKEEFVLVPGPVAERIAQRDATTVLVNLNKSASRDSDEKGGDEDDPYAEYQIPDDLDW